MALTVKGAPMNRVQQDTVNTIMSVGQQLNASNLALTACIFDAIYESDMGTNLGPNSAGYGGILGGATSVFGNVHTSATAMATAWFNGGKGFQAGGGIAASTHFTDVAVLGSQVTAAIPFDSNGISTQYESQGFPIASAVAEAKAIVTSSGGGAVSISSGTSVNAAASGTTPFYVGDSTNPHEDVWTAVNRLAQARQWYIFSDGETAYLADGNDLMAQDPVLSIDRWRDADRIVHLDFTWDNTAYQYASTHKHRSRVQRKSTLAKVTSPVTASLSVICDVDEVRGGDVVEISGAGPGDGKWLVGDCVRSVFRIYSELTLVPGIQPLTEVQAEGGSNPAAQPGARNKVVPTFGRGTLSTYVNPFQNFRGDTPNRGTYAPSRVDMGVDYSGNGTLVAIADGVVVSTANSGWPGGTFIEQSIDTGPFAGHHWYYAEHISPLVVPRQTVKAGDPIGVLQGDMETGWSVGDGGDTLAAKLNQQAPGKDPGAWTSAAGASANRLLVALGAVSGKLQGPPHGSMPKGYP